MTPTIVAPAQAVNLKTLAVEINRAHDQASKARQTTLKEAVAAGDRLIVAKSLCGHGKWLDWLKKNVKCHQTQAAKYMRLARAQAQFKTGLSLAAALTLLEQDADPETEPSEADAGDAAEIAAILKLLEAAAKVLCDRCQRVGAVPDCEKCAEARRKAEERIKKDAAKKKKSGTVKFSWKDWEKKFGPVARSVDTFAEAYPAEKHCAELKTALNGLDIYGNAMAALRERIER